MNIKSTQKILFAALIAAGMNISYAHAAALNTSVEFSYDKQKSSVPQAKFTLTNTGSHSVWVLQRELPNAKTLTNNQFRVTRDGQELSYHGAMVKYPAPTASDYVEIKAGQTYNSTVDIAKYYDMEKGGTFGINFRTNQLTVLESAPASKGVVRTLTKTDIALGENKHLAFTGAPGSLQKKTASAAALLSTSAVTTKASGVTLQFVNCSSARQATLKTAVTNATTYNTKAQAWVKANPNGGALYKTWFGAYTTSRFATVKGHYDGIATEFAGKTIRLECDDTSEYMAYVYQDDAYHIYLGQGYWPADDTGYDSKAGTLIHESSHFNVNGGTQDYVYGLQEGQALAKSTPDHAVQNADNVEHFAESL